MGKLLRVPHIVVRYQLVNRETWKLESSFVGKETKDTVGWRGNLAVNHGQCKL